MEKGREISYSKWVVAAAVVILTTLSSAAAGFPISKPGCQDKCGNVAIPYPFGIGDKCSHNSNFSITCNHTFRPPTPKPIYGTNLEVLKISLQDGQIRISNYVARVCYNGSGEQLSRENNWIELNKFTLNTKSNIFAATGCDTYAWFEGKQSRDRHYSTGCMTICHFPEEVNNWTCSGVGCCESQIPKGVHSISVTANSFNNYTDSPPVEVKRCSSAFVVARDSFNFSLANLTMSSDQMAKELPVVYDWTIGDETCAIANTSRKCLCCDGRGTKCVDSVLGGYRCSCLPGYSGNPYLAHGCQDIDECSSEDGKKCKKPAICHNTRGSYRCQCPKRFHGNGTIENPCHSIQESNQVKIILGASGSIIFLLMLGFFLYWNHEKKQMTKMRQTFFRQNGGLILDEKCREASIELIKIFSPEDLQKATGNYSKNNVIGQGGFGMVYKGVLPGNQVVAIKKSLKVDSSQTHQFINEIVVLSKLNNRNVVKILGCCLETEIPLLVYEFITNGTLYDHLHDEKKALLLTWDIRLRIATEVAEVLSYLHITVSTPIIHRDIKSMNILLDDNYVAKVSDFGASKLVPFEQDQVATTVQGTRGYLDPEYM